MQLFALKLYKPHFHVLKKKNQWRMDLYRANILKWSLVLHCYSFFIALFLIFLALFYFLVLFFFLLILFLFVYHAYCCWIRSNLRLDSSTCIRLKCASHIPSFFHACTWWAIWWACWIYRILVRESRRKIRKVQPMARKSSEGRTGQKTRQRRKIKIFKGMPNHEPTEIGK